MNVLIVHHWLDLHRKCIQDLLFVFHEAFSRRVNLTVGPSDLQRSSGLPSSPTVLHPGKRALGPFIVCVLFCQLQKIVDQTHSTPTRLSSDRHSFMVLSTKDYNTSVLYSQNIHSPLSLRLDETASFFDDFFAHGLEKEDHNKQISSSWYYEREDQSKNSIIVVGIIKLSRCFYFCL